MSSIWIIVALILGFLVVFQIAKASEYVSILHGEDKTRKESNRINGFMLLIFLVAGLFGVWYCNHTLIDKTLGEPASNHGVHVDIMIHITFWVTFVVFVATQIALFWFSFKYQEKEGQKAYYFPHNNRLELIWTVIPAIVLTVLVGFGLYYWYEITGEAPKESQIVEVTGKQFGWEFRYPGADGVLGKKYYRAIDPAHNNPLGQLWEDPANHDDIYGSQDMHIVVNKPVKLIIYSKDVIHDVGLSHFRLKMDAVPGVPTTMWFTPRFTTREMKQKYGDDFTYEISCDQICGRGHFSMRGTIVVETQAEYNLWLKQQKSQYALLQEAEKGAAPASPAADSTKSGPTAMNTTPVKSK